MNKLPSRTDYNCPIFLTIGLIAPLLLLFIALGVRYELLGWGMIAWSVVIGISWGIALTAAEKLNTPANHFDAPVTDWPPMSLDHFKWVVWNCELRGREITQEDAREYFINNVHPGLEYMMRSKATKVALSFGRFARDLPNHSDRWELIDDLLPATPVKTPQSRI